MTTDTYTLRILTPCFCAGADQARAEIRPSSIRGQLRWWFRALGGTPEDESALFGGIHGDTPNASVLVVRVSTVKKPTEKWEPPRFSPNDPESYVWYYASASANGTRWKSEAAMPPRTEFKLHIVFRRTLNPALKRRLDDALHCFLALGAIGLRVTRGLGAFTCNEYPYDQNRDAIRAILAAADFKIEHTPGDFADVNAIVREIGTLLKGTRKNLQMPAKSPSPFGSSARPRQTSAIYFRPVMTVNNRLALVVFEASPNRILDLRSRKSRVVGAIPSNLVRALPSRRKY